MNERYEKAKKGFQGRIEEQDESIRRLQVECKDSQELIEKLTKEKNNHDEEIAAIHGDKANALSIKDTEIGRITYEN